MRFGPWVLAGTLLGVGSLPLADATVLYPEETAAMREAWVRATSRVGQARPARGEATCSSPGGHGVRPASRHQKR